MNHLELKERKYTLSSLCISEKLEEEKQRSTGHSVENTLKFMREACEEIFTKFGQKITNFHADGRQKIAKRVEGPTTKGEVGYLVRNKKGKRTTTWLRSQ
jgi:hypothetical protein